LRVSLSRLVDSSAETMPSLVSAVDLCVALKMLPDSEKEGAATPTRHSELEARILTAICDEEWGDGLAGNIRRLLWVGTQVRERFSLDNWHALNRLQRQLQRYNVDRPEVSDALAFLDQILLASSSLAGFAMDDMTRDDGWRFLIIGRRLERLSFFAQAIADFLRIDSARGPGCLEWLLELSDSIITYRSRYSRTPELLPVIDLLVFDDSNPHGVIFQASVLGRYLDRMARELGATFDGKLGEALERLRAFDLERLEHLQFDDCHECKTCEELATLLVDLNVAAIQLSDYLGMRYFTHVGDVSRQTMAL
jgi:uncharacterized alpha-E superfamily protein